MLMDSRVNDLSGRRFERLVVLLFSGSRNGDATWLCRCDCGVEKIIRAQCLINGNTLSCGCLARERTTAVHKLHGESSLRNRTKEYRTWVCMRYRCLNVKNRQYKNYGGRGITICERWMESFQNFLSDMGRRPKGMTLDRINNDGPYSPENCRWADWKTQANNRRGNKMITFRGVSLTAPQWSKKIGVHKTTLRMRVRNGWPIDVVLSSKRFYRGGKIRPDLGR